MTNPSAELPDSVDELRSGLLEWYEENSRDLPWRNTTEPFHILVAEVMSQQTQIQRVVGPYTTFIDKWPTPEALSDAPQSEVVTFWSEHSLGYNNRAKYLHQAAERIVEEYDGCVPSTLPELKSLSGVGPYTAAAVSAFAFNRDVAVVDTNVKRILYRAFDIEDDDAIFERVSSDLLPTGQAATWNNAIMELGGLVCTPTPSCDAGECPWREWCHAYRTGDFTAPDVPSQPDFSGSRRQYRGRIIRALSSEEGMPVGELGPMVRVDYGTPEADRSWLEDLIDDLVSDGLVTRESTEKSDEVRVRLRQ